MLQYTNPRQSATFNDWPSGKQRTTCTFTVETKNGKQRVSRVTIDPKTGRPCAPKTTTYGLRATILDGTDGKTYIATLGQYGSIHVMQWNLQFEEESISDNDPRYAALKLLLVTRTDEVTA